MINSETANMRALDIFQNADPVVHGYSARARRDPRPDRGYAPARGRADCAGAHVRPDARCAGGSAALRRPRGRSRRRPIACSTAAKSASIRATIMTAVAPMAGIISPSMPVWIIENRTNGARAYSNLNEGPGRTLRYGANSPDVIERLRWMQITFAPRLREAVLRLERAGDLPAGRRSAGNGRRVPQPQSRRADAAHPEAYAGAASKPISPSSEIREVLDFHDRARLFLPQPDDGSLQIGLAGSRESPGYQSRHRLFAQRRRVRHSRAADAGSPPNRRSSTGIIFEGYQRRPMPTVTSATALSLKPAAWAVSRRAASPAVIGFIGGSAASLMRVAARNVRHHADGEPPFPAASARISRHAHRR